MVQWTNLQQIKKSVNWMCPYATCENLEACTYIVEPDFMAGWQALAVYRNIKFSALFSRGTALFQQL